MLRALGYACYGFAAIDLGTYWFGIADITGVSWSPVAAIVAGSMLVKMSAQAPAGTVHTTQTPAIKS